jgi:Domain of unknown function (DUF4124)
MGRVNAFKWMCGIALACAGMAHAVEIYKWIDENGTTHYSDTKPAGVKATRIPDGGVSVIPGSRIGAEAARAAERERASASRDIPVDIEAQELAQARAQRREQLMQDCARNNGVDCQREVDTQLRAEGIQEGRGVIRTVPPAATAPAGPVPTPSPSPPGSALR